MEESLGVILTLVAALHSIITELENVLHHFIKRIIKKN
jgi:hypothetical protein